ncbi:cholesterol 24-hydroxylase-like [Denticeps clupeoides]|uniref:Cholesterol 24-hydroxylase n=1 Tax=Denticeps clupeoides TaxID=299321 RepID=A0A8C4ACU1_9TELE|nr:cholesterol 24-hydroxylase-like [Denticeps clupeoides]
MALLHVAAVQAGYLLAYLLAVLLLLFFCYCLYVRHVHAKYDHLPGPPRESFLLGHSRLIARESRSGRVVHDRFLEWAEKYGPVYRLNFLHYVSVAVYDQEATKEILMSPKYTKDKFVYKRLFNMYGTRFLGNGLVTAIDHDLWYRQRRIMDPAFSSSYLRGLMSTFNERADRLMDKLAELAESQSPAMMRELVNKVTLDVITKVAFGVDLDLFHTSNSPFPRAIERCLEGTLHFLRDPMFEYYPQNRKEVRETRKAVQLLRETGSKWITERKEAVQNGEDVPMDILTQILKSAEENKSHEDDWEIMLDNFLTFFIAGQETTANQLAFAIMELGRLPEIMAKLREEVDEVIGTKPEVSYEDLGNLTYLSQVLKETLRLYPTAPGTTRWAADDIVIDGIKIPGGFQVVLSSYVSSRLERFFKDPLKFDPERFSLDAPKPYFCYYPFALGPRSCLGQNFSQMEAKVVLAKLVQRFDYTLLPGQSFDILDTGTLRPLSGVQCLIKTRDSTLK